MKQSRMQFATAIINRV